MNTVYFAPETDVSISFKKPTAEEYDEDEEAFYLNSFNILASGTRKTIEYQSPVKLFINSKLLTIDAMTSDSEEITISSSSTEEETFIFKYQPKNNELTASLQQILDLIETSDHLGISDYHTFVNKFNELLIANELNFIPSIHIEMISATLIKDPDTKKRPDFSKEILDPYVINRVSKTVLEGPLAASISFERINDQLIDLATYEKTEKSIMDNLFF